VSGSRRVDPKCTVGTDRNRSRVTIRVADTAVARMRHSGGILPSSHYRDGGMRRGFRPTPGARRLMHRPTGITLARQWGMTSAGADGFMPTDVGRGCEGVRYRRLVSSRPEGEATPRLDRQRHREPSVDDDGPVSRLRSAAREIAQLRKRIEKAQALERQERWPARDARRRRR
jgi:hypothetical protein